MKKLLLCICILPLLLVWVSAEGDAELDTDSLIQELPEEGAQMLQGISIQEQPDLLESISVLLRAALKNSNGSIRQGLKLCVSLLGILLLCSLCQTATNYSHTANIVGVLACLTCVSGSVHTMHELACNTVEELSTYSAFLLPVMASALAMSGAPTTAASLHAGTVLFAQLLMQLTSKLLVPGVYVYLLLAAAEASLQNDILSELRELVGWLLSKSLRITLYLFTGFISITGVIGGSGDAIAIKATKAAISGMIPVVGNIISDASDTLLASASILKNSVGVFGLIAVLGICIVPFLKVGIQYLMMKVTAAVSAAVGGKPHVQFLKHISTAMGFLLGMTGACALLLLISCVCFLKVVV